MTASLVASNTYVFSDGNSGHVCNLGSSPSVGQEDVLYVNSDATVTTPAGFAATNNVSNQGVYSFRRLAAGGEASTVTITTSAGVPAAVHWSRWDNILLADDAASSRLEDGGNTSTPSHTTGTLSATGEIMFAFAALHDIGSADQNTPVWSSGYTPLTTAIQGSGATGVAGFVAYKLNAGTAPETPSVSWSGSAAKDRVMLTLSFTASASTAPARVAVSPRRRRQILPRPRTRRAVTPPNTQIQLPPVYPPLLAHQPRRLRAMRPRRAGSVTPVPAQVIVAATPYPPRTVRVRTKLVRLFRGRQSTPIHSHAAPLAAMVRPRPHRRQVMVRRHIAVPPPAPVDVPLFTRIRTKLARMVRGQAVTVVPPQVVLLPPPYPPAPTRIPRKLFKARRLRGVADGWVVQSIHDRNTHRPDSGTTGRPDSGRITRPITGTTPRP